jgi:hypothetical protein
MSEKRVDQLIDVQKESLELFRKKNMDYGDAFATYGPVGVIVRMGDKIQRLLSISKKGITLIDSESLRDTLIDLHNYSAMAIMLIDEEREKNDNNDNNDNNEKFSIDFKDINRY